MMRWLRYTFLLVTILSCVEPYEFRIIDTSQRIVIEATLSDKSFNDTKNYPSDGRYFSVKLSRTSDVVNVRSEAVSYAIVVLINEQGEEWTYGERSDTPGYYELIDDDFKALTGVRYKLKIQTPDDEQIESDWEMLPDPAPPMGPIGFRETTTQKVLLDEVREIQGVTPNITVPVNETGNPIYYQWKYIPTWIFTAALASTTDAMTKTCWASTPYYLRGYTVLLDNDGGYQKDFFFMDTRTNERILYEFSMLVQQEVLNEDYYYFRKEMQDRNQPGGVFSIPPYNLNTNYHSSAGSVFGYFGVVREEGKRWYFNRNDLSYGISDWLVEQCTAPCLGPGCPPPDCYNCLRYEGGDVINVKPSWWGR